MRTPPKRTRLPGRIAISGQRKPPEKVLPRVEAARRNSEQVRALLHLDDDDGKPRRRTLVRSDAYR